MQTVVAAPFLPETTSIDDLQKMLTPHRGIPEALAPTPKPEAPKPPETAPAAPPATPTEAAPVETPAAEPVKKTPEGEEPTPANSQEPKPPEAGEKPAKEKKWYDRRLSTMARQRDEERIKAELLQRELDALRAQPGPKPPAAEEPKPPVVEAPKPGVIASQPKLKDYTGKVGEEGGYEDYDDAVQACINDTRTFDKQQAEATAAKSVHDAVEAEATKVFQQDMEKAFEAHPDFDAARAAVVQGSVEGLQKAISNLPREEGIAPWTDVVLHLAENETALERLNALFQKNPYAATAQLGVLAKSLGSGSAQAPKPPAQSTPRPPAPKPPAVVGGGAAPVAVDINQTKDLNLVAEELKKLGYKLPRGF